MTSDIKSLPSSYIFYLAFSAVLWITYIVLTFTAPINEATNIYHLSYSQLMWVKLSVVLPFFLIWIFGIFAATGITRYISTIKGSPEEKGFAGIQSGVLVLLLGLTIGAVVGAIRSFLMDDESARIILSVIVSYFNVLMPLIAFGYFFSGATTLARLTKKPISMLSNIVPLILVLAAALFYAWVVFSNPDRQLGVGPQHTGALYLPDEMIVLTLMVPYVTMWALGLFAAFRLLNYRNSVQGLIYRSALSWLTGGILFIILLSITFQGLALLRDFFAAADLKTILIAVYLILAAIAVGYIFLWFGARKLRIIETVV